MQQEVAFTEFLIESTRNPILLAILLPASKQTFKYYLDRHNLDWECAFCALPKWNDSFFDDDLQRLQALSGNVHDSVEHADNNILAENEIRADFDEIAKNYGSNFKIAHINGNSFGGFKFHEIKTWLLPGRLDLLVISESKIDANFPDSMFHVEGFRLCRRDRKALDHTSALLGSNSSKACRRKTCLTLGLSQ